MPPLSPDHDSRADSFSRKRARSKYSVNGGTDNAPSTKRHRNTAASQQKAQDFVPQKAKFNTHGDVLAQASDVRDSDTSGDEQQETTSDGGSLVLSTGQTEVAQATPRVNWNAGAKSKIRTTLGGSEGNTLKPSLLGDRKQPSYLTLPDCQNPMTKGFEQDQELEIEGTDSTSGSTHHKLLDGSKEPDIATVKNTNGQELTVGVISTGENGGRRSASPPRLLSAASESAPIIVEKREKTEIKSIATSGRSDPQSPWLSLDVYTIICQFVHTFPSECERRERIGRQMLYKSKQTNDENGDFKELPQEYQDGSLEELRAYLFSFDLDLPQQHNVLGLEKLAAARYSGSDVCHDQENQAEAIFFRHLDEQKLADPRRREAVHETEIAFTKHIIEGYQYDHLMCVLLTPDELYEKGIGSLQHIHSYRTPQEYREQLLGKCNRSLADPEDIRNTQRMAKVDFDKIMCEYGYPFAQQNGDEENRDGVILSDGNNSKRCGDGHAYDPASKLSSSLRLGCCSKPDLQREIHEVEVAYWRGQISRGQYNERRWKLYTTEEAKEKGVEWPPRRVYSPAGYRDSEFEYPGPASCEGEELDDILLEFGCDIEDGENEAAAKERFRKRIEAEFPDVEARQAEYRRWEKIREVEAEFYHDRISRDEYNERRHALYTDSELEEREIEWPLDHCQSPAGRREDIFDTFVRSEPSYEARMEFHFPYPLEYEDATDEVQLCELCTPLIEQQRVENAEYEKARTTKAVEAKAKQEKRNAERAAKAPEGKGVDKTKRKKKKNKVQVVSESIRTTKDVTRSEKGSKGSFMENPEALSMSNSTGVSDRDAEPAELPTDRQKAQTEVSKQNEPYGSGSEGSKDEGEVSEVDVDSGRLSELKPTTTRKSKRDYGPGPSSKHSPLGQRIVPPEPTTVGDLSALERQLQSRYFPIMQAGYRNEDNGKNPARCLACFGEGHTGDNCSKLVCQVCGSANSHFTYACPQSIRCDKCHERGHTTHSCPSKLARSEAADGLKCDICQRNGHFESSCSRIWRTTFSSGTPMRKVSSLPIFCYNCGACGHFGTDCRLRLGDIQPKSILGGSSFSLDNLNRFLLTEHKIERKAEFAIKGRAAHKVREDSESEEFFRPPVAGVARGRCEPGNDGRSPNRPIHIRMPDSYRARSPHRQPGPSADGYYRPQRGRKRSLSPFPRHPQDDWRDSRRDNYEGRGEGRGRGDSWQPPLPRDPPPTNRGRGGGRGRGRGRGYGDDVYRPMPSAASNARKQFRR